MIDMLKRHEIQVLRRADHTWSVTAVTNTTTIALGRTSWQQACSTDPRARGHSRSRGGQRCGCSHSLRTDLPQLRSRGPRAHILA